MQYGSRVRARYDIQPVGSGFISGGELLTVVGTYADDDDPMIRVRTFDGYEMDVNGDDVELVSL